MDAAGRQTAQHAPAPPASDRLFPARRLALWILLAALTPAAAQPPSLDGYFRQTWSTRDGLPHNSINAIAQTPEGYLWFGTWEGLARFNGREFVNHERGPVTGLPDSAVRALHLDHSGALWATGARGGLARVFEGEWTALEPVPGLGNAIVVSADGDIFVGTQNAGLVKVAADGERQRWSAGEGLPADVVSALLELDGRLWVGTSGGLAVGDANGFVEVGAADGIGSVFALAADAEGRLLVGTDRGVLRALAPGSVRFEAIHAELAGDAVTALLADDDGSLWIGTVSRGLFRASARGLETFGVADGLPNSRILSLLRDREGSLWVGTNGGLLRLSDAPFNSLTRARGLSDDFVRAVMAHSGGGIWVGTSRGLDRIVDGRPQRVGAGTPLQEASVLSLAEASSGGLWIGTYQTGALHWNGGDIVRRLDVAQGLPANEVRAIIESPDGSLWMGTPLGLARVAASGDVRTLTTADGMPDDYVFSLMLSSHGELWVGTGVGAGVVENGRVRALAIEAVSDAEAVFDIYEEADGAYVWLVTDRGLIRWRRGDGHLATVSRGLGLPFDKFFHLVDDGQGGFWLTSNRGVVRVERSAVHAVADGLSARLDHEVFSEAEGLASAQCNGGSQPSATLGADGAVWVATARGAARVHPARLPSFAEVVPTVVIESFMVDGERRDWRRPQVLDPGAGRIEIRFAGLAFRMPDRIRYRYRLEGFDRDWVERGNVSYAEFTTLPPGDYRFRVQAVQSHGRWGDGETVLEFRIEPHLWERPLFWLSGISALLLLAFLALRQRLRRGRLQQLQLQRLVERRTAELREKTDAFERQAREDALTGLTNRRAFDENLAREFERANRHHGPLCLALLDIDRFKQINDRYSHAVGDQVLRAVALQMRRQCREIDLLSRWGGEEFALLFPNTRPEDARAVCERLRVSLEELDLDGIASGLRLTVSIGVASHADVPDYDRLVSRADAALYRAKQAGRNRVEGP